VIGRGATVLEVGAGLGSATEALLERLREAGRVAAIARSRLTEPVPLFRRRAERTLAALHPAVPLACEALDINRPWREQGVEPGASTRGASTSSTSPASCTRSSARPGRRSHPAAGS
jgi:hypothetical protein